MKMIRFWAFLREKLENLLKGFFYLFPYILQEYQNFKLMYKISNPWSILVKIKVSLIVKYFHDEIYLIFINFIPLKVPMYAWCLGWYSVTYSLSSTKKEDYNPLKTSSNISNEYYNPPNKNFKSFVI